MNNATIKPYTIIPGDLISFVPKHRDIAKISNVIGQGTYGCVHKPSLRCKQKNVSYKNKISKILKTSDADIEMNEYNTIDKVDPHHDFYLGKPIKCIPDNSNINIKSIELCQDPQQFLEEFNDLSLLIIEDGGINLEEFAQKIDDWDVTPENIEKIEIFWMEAHRILTGLRVFINHGMVHHDLKPQNFVYDISKNRVNFIDFGLMTTRDTIIKESISSEYHLGKFHWSFPFEIQFYNKSAFDNFTSKTETQKKTYYQKFIRDFKKSSTSKNGNDIANALKTFFYYTIKSDLSKNEYENIIKLYFEDYYRMIIYELNKDTKYEDFLKKSIDTFDIYGTGIAFFCVLSHSLRFLDESLVNSLTGLFYFMVTPNLQTRMNINTLIHKYENILKNHGLLTKYNKHFENHHLMNGPEMPMDISSKLATIEKKDVAISREEMDRIILSKIRECPPGKEYKPSTRRCVKQCKDGYIRNVHFKCTKNKTKKRSSRI